MRCKLVALPVALLIGTLECVQSAGELSPSDHWRIRNGWPARDGTERIRWAANGYGPNGEKLSDQAPSGTATTSNLQRLGVKVRDFIARIESESAKLSSLIPRAEYASDVLKLCHENIFGMLDPKAYNAFVARHQQLCQDGKSLREGTSAEDVGVLLNSMFADIAKLRGQLRTAAGNFESERTALLEQQVSKLSERASQAAAPNPRRNGARYNTINQTPVAPRYPAAPNLAATAPALPRHVATHDSAGNFHTGVVQPTGFYNGTVLSPSGGVGHVNGHVSPAGSFHGTDNNGGFYHGH